MFVGFSLQFGEQKDFFCLGDKKKNLVQSMCAFLHVGLVSVRGPLGGGHDRPTREVRVRGEEAVSELPEAAHRLRAVARPQTYRQPCRVERRQHPRPAPVAPQRRPAGEHQLAHDVAACDARLRAGRGLCAAAVNSHDAETDRLAVALRQGQGAQGGDALQHAGGGDGGGGAVRAAHIPHQRRDLREDAEAYAGEPPVQD